VLSLDTLSLAGLADAFAVVLRRQDTGTAEAMIADALTPAGFVDIVIQRETSPAPNGCKAEASPPGVGGDAVGVSRGAKSPIRDILKAPPPMHKRRNPANSPKGSPPPSRKRARFDSPPPKGTAKGRGVEVDSDDERWLPRAPRIDVHI